MPAIKLNDCLACGGKPRWARLGVETYPLCKQCGYVGVGVPLGKEAKSAEIWNINNTPKKA